MAKFTLALTSAGVTLLGKALTSKKLTFTKMALGDGEYTGTAVDKTALTAEKVRVNIGEIARSGASAILRATVVYADLPSEFKWRELGIYAADPDGGSDILYAYANAGASYDTIGGNDALREMIVRARIAISETADLTVTVQSGSTVYVSKSDFDAIADKVTAITSGSAEYGSTVITLTHTYTSPTHAFTGLGSRTGLIPAQFKATAGYTEGDTATIDGESYTIQLTGADAPETDLFTAGKSVLVDIDTEGKTINFKAGGGLTGGKLALATAEEDEVFAGKTFYAGDKVLRTGTALSEETTATGGQIFNGFTAYDNAGQLITGSALSEATDVVPENLFSGKKAYNNAGGLVVGTALGTATTAAAGDIRAGKTAYSNNGNLITGTNSFTAVLLSSGEIFTPSSANGTVTLSIPSGALYCQMSTHMGSDRDMIGSSVAIGAITPLNTGTSSEFGINGYMTIHRGGGTASWPVAWWGNNQITFKALSNYTRLRVYYQFYGIK